MDTQDMVLGGKPVNRLAVVKKVAGEFIQGRRGDRVGLVLFGSRAYLQTPLTFDTETTAVLLEESEIGLAGRETAIGDAIGLAVKRLREDAASERVLILLTDGANTSGEVQPIQATEFAAREGLRIYTVGVGADEMMVQDFFGSRLVNPSADLDEDTLMAIAERTGGAYFRARDAEALARIYEQLDELEPVESDQEAIRPVDELFFWPLAAAFLLALVGLGVSMWPGGWLARAGRSGPGTVAAARGARP
jgi:Ca-activated chloride channel family protein